MPFMPFQVLGLWLRALFSLAVLGGGIFLFAEWFNHREVYVTEPVVVAVPERPAEDAPPRRAEVREEHVRRVRWEFGWNRETAYLLGGLALLAWSFGGRLLSPSLWRRRGTDEPAELPRGEVRRLRRPDGTEIHAELFGPADGPPVVLTHGWGLDRNEWCYAVRELAGRWRVITWDLPGLGRSAPPADNDYRLEKLAGDLDLVLGLAGDRPAVLVGHSIGGMILLTFCRLFPAALGRRVAGLVIAHSTYTNPVKTTARAGLYTALQKPVLEPLCHLMVWLAPVLWLLNWLSYWNGSAHRSTERSSFSGRESRGQLNFLTRDYVRAWPAVVGRGLLAMFRYDATATLRTIPVPTLVVTGDQDRTCRPEASVEMSRAIPAATLRTLQPARHCGLFKHHGAFDADVQAFMARCAEPQARPIAG